MSDTPNYSPEGRNPQPSSSFQLNHPTVVSLLYLGGFVTGISALIGLILAYIWGGDRPAEWEQSHFRYHIRTFWICVLQAIIAGLICLTIILIPLAVLWYIWIVVWTAVRTIKALLAAQKQQPIHNPGTWLW